MTPNRVQLLRHLDGHEYGARTRHFCQAFVGWRTAGILLDIHARTSALRTRDTDRRARRGLIMSFGTFFRYYDEYLLPEATDTTIGLIGGIQAFIVLLLSFIVGRLLDAKFHRIIVGVGGVLAWLGYFCLSFTLQGPENQGSYGLIILTQSIVAGVGMTCFFTHSSHCAIQVRKQSAQGHVLEADILVEWFPQQKYFAVGITSAGAAVGMMDLPSSFISFHSPCYRGSCLSTGDCLFHHRTRLSCWH